MEISPRLITYAISKDGEVTNGSADGLLVRFPSGALAVVNGAEVIHAWRLPQGEFEKSKELTLNGKPYPVAAYLDKLRYGAERKGITESARRLLALIADGSPINEDEFSSEESPMPAVATESNVDKNEDESTTTIESKKETPVKAKRVRKKAVAPTEPKAKKPKVGRAAKFSKIALTANGKKDDVKMHAGRPRGKVFAVIKASRSPAPAIADIVEKCREEHRLSEAVTKAAINKLIARDLVKGVAGE